MVRDSMGLRNFKLSVGSEARALAGGTIELLSAPPATSPNLAKPGTVLGIITLSGGTHTAEVQAYGSVKLTAGATGNTVTGITVNSVEILGATIPYTNDLLTTAALIVAQINRYQTKGVEYTAVSDGAAEPTITITAELGIGATANSWTVTSSVTGFSKTDTAMANGVTAVNGLTYEGAASGALAKNVTETWSGTFIAAGTVQSFRMKAAVADADAASQTAIRKDGIVAIIGGDMTLSNTTATVGAPFTVSSFEIDQPESQNG